MTATDGGGEFKTVFYSITVTDVNDNSPRFIMGDYYIVSLREDQSVRVVCELKLPMSSY